MRPIQEQVWRAVGLHVVEYNPLGERNVGMCSRATDAEVIAALPDLIRELTDLLSTAALFNRDTDAMWMAQRERVEDVLRKVGAL